MFFVVEGTYFVASNMPELAVVAGIFKKSWAVFEKTANDLLFAANSKERKT